MTQRKTVAHYELIRRLGKGGMGEVWLAEDTKLDRQVAVKFLSQLLVANPEAQERFHREARAAAQIDHPNVVPVHEFGETEKESFLVMGYVEGDSLRAHIERARETPIPIGKALEWIREAAEGLAAAHEHNVIHRDIKPDNLFVAESGMLRIGDFGLARLDADTQLTATGSQMGTLNYMSPEQARGMKTDHRTDLFSLGATLYELLAGHKAFEAETPAGVLYAIVHSDPTPLKEIRQDVPEAVAALVTAMLQKDPEQRPPTARAVAGELRRIEQGVSAGMTVAIAPGLRPSRKTPWRRIIIGVAGLTVVLGGIFGIPRLLPWPSPPEPTLDPRAIAVLPFRYQGSDSLSPLGEGMVELLSATLNGAAGMTTMDPQAVLALVSEVGGVGLNESLHAEVAKELGAGLFIHGTVSDEGNGRLRIYSVGLHETLRWDQPVFRESTHLAGAEVEGDMGHLFRLVDDVTAQLLVNEVKGPGEDPPALTSITTSSLPALMAFLDADYEGAVDIDSTFALAWLRIADLADRNGNLELQQKASARVIRYESRLPLHYRSRTATMGP